MAFTQSDLDAIRTALSRGERVVQFADRMVTYRSVDELLALEERIARALAAPTTTTSKQSIGVAGKGL